MNVVDILISPFADFSFMRRALAGCIALSFAGAPIGVFLMLRRMSLTGDAIAHAILPGVAVGFLLAGVSLTAMTVGGLIAGLAVALAAGWVSHATLLREDASLAVFYLGSLALGVTLISVSGSGVDLLHILFGSVLALDDESILVLASVSSLTVAVFVMLYRAFILESFDAGFLQVVGGRRGAIHGLFLALTVLTMVAGFQALGTLMVVGLMMIPAAASRFWARHVWGMILCAALIALISCVAGLLASYHLDLPSGPAIILAAIVFYALSMALGRVESLRLRFSHAPHLEG